MEIRALRENETEECITLWTTVWPGDNDAYFRRYFEGDVEWLPYYTQVAVDAGRLVSAVHICPRTVACGDFRLRMGGIANVVTLPEYRGRGLNSACLRAAIGVMEADAMDFSLLFTGINGYYAREGFATVPFSRLRGRTGANRRAELGAFNVRPASPEDIEAIFRVYDEYNAARPVAVRRTPGYWRDWIGLTPEKLTREEPPLVAVDRAGRVVGYVSIQLGSDEDDGDAGRSANVTEFGSAHADGPEAEEIAAALLDGAAGRAMAAGRRELHLDIALDPSIRRAAERVLENVTEDVTDSAMSRLLHRDNLARSFLLEWNDRWAAAGRPRGELVFGTPYGQTRLDASGTFLKVDACDGMGGELSQEALLGLLLGATTPEQAATHADQQPLLKALFPISQSAPDGVYWGADGF